METVWLHDCIDRCSACVFMLVHTHTHMHTNKWEDSRIHVFVKETRKYYNRQIYIINSISVIQVILNYPLGNTVFLKNESVTSNIL